MNNYWIIDKNSKTRRVTYEEFLSHSNWHIDWSIEKDDNGVWKSVEYVAWEE
jgi:hypothetical protein